VRVGFVELIDAAPLIAAAALGYFVDEGVDVALSRELGWGNVRDKLQFERLDAAHCVIGLPVQAAQKTAAPAATRTARMMTIRGFIGFGIRCYGNAASSEISEKYKKILAK